MIWSALCGSWIRSRLNKDLHSHFLVSSMRTQLRRQSLPQTVSHTILLKDQGQAAGPSTRPISVHLTTDLRKFKSLPSPVRRLQEHRRVELEPTSPRAMLPGKAGSPPHCSRTASAGEYTRAPGQVSGMDSYLELDSCVSSLVWEVVKQIYAIS